MIILYSVGKPFHVSATFGAMFSNGYMDTAVLSAAASVPWSRWAKAASSAAAAGWPESKACRWKNGGNKRSSKSTIPKIGPGYICFKIFGDKLIPPFIRHPEILISWYRKLKRIVCLWRFPRPLFHHHHHHLYRYIYKYTFLHNNFFKAMYIYIYILYKLPLFHHHHDIFQGWCFTSLSILPEAVP